MQELGQLYIVSVTACCWSVCSLEHFLTKLQPFICLLYLAESIGPLFDRTRFCIAFVLEFLYNLIKPISSLHSGICGLPVVVLIFAFSQARLQSVTCSIINPFASPDIDLLLVDEKTTCLFSEELYLSKKLVFDL